MILKFRHKGLERLFTKGDTSGVSPQRVKKLRHMLVVLHRSKGVQSLNLSGGKLHPLKGDRKGQWSVSALGNWRLIFECVGDDVTNVDIIDYH
jgi:proteic killer suppression protein